MKQSFFLAVVLLISAQVFAADTNLASADIEAKYTAAIEGRTGDILKALSLSDADKAAKVHDIIIAQYRALNTWHNENDPNLKAAKGDTNAIGQIHASLKTLHDKFLYDLGENLTPDQVEQVKDKMTYGKVQFTFKGYVAQYPNLTEENKQEILTMLKQAREEAMDGGSAQEKTAIFQRYKGKINNYLSKQGVHPEKQKVGAVTNSASDKQ
jgi:hypothetical protein